jgi:hypothetical protein
MTATSFMGAVLKEFGPEAEARIMKTMKEGSEYERGIDARKAAASGLKARAKALQASANAQLADAQLKKAQKKLDSADAAQKKLDSADAAGE